jgi:hypothetical protein
VTKGAAMSEPIYGLVRGMSKDRTRFAVLTDRGFTVFDTDDSDIEMNHEISGSLEDHGDVVLVNKTTGQIISAYIEAIQATRESARSLLLHR